jgi:hypothetical protein
MENSEKAVIYIYLGKGQAFNWRIQTYVLTGTIPLCPQALDPEIISPALEGTGAVLNTAHDIGTRDQGDLGVADEDVAPRLVAIMRDGRGLEKRFTITRANFQFRYVSRSTS